jgi:hypothetical protein
VESGAALLEGRLAAAVEIPAHGVTWVVVE